MGEVKISDLFVHSEERRREERSREEGTK